MMNRFLDTMWGQANALFTPFRRRRWVDLLLVAAAFGMLYGLILLGHQWTAIQRPVLAMDLSPWALPKYTFFSMMGGWRPTCSPFSSLWSTPTGPPRMPARSACWCLCSTSSRASPS